MTKRNMPISSAANHFMDLIFKGQADSPRT
jgi:hypothetical protein